MRKLIKKILHPFLKARYNSIGKNGHTYSYKGISLFVEPTVFSPQLTISTKIFLNYLSKQSLSNKKVLELGAGSGLLSFYSEQQGAKVTASDLSGTAIKGLEKNKKRLNSTVSIVHSDLFEEITDSFNYILINPPYYPKNPTNIEEAAWFCGEHFEYFKALFKQLNERKQFNELSLIILSQDCDIAMIKSIAKENQLAFKQVHKKWSWGEWNYIFKIYVT